MVLLGALFPARPRLTSPDIVGRLLQMPCLGTTRDVEGREIDFGLSPIDVVGCEHQTTC